MDQECRHIWERFCVSAYQWKVCYPSVLEVSKSFQFLFIFMREGNAQFNPVYPKVKKRNSLDVIMWGVFENIITPVAWPFWGYCDARSSLRLLFFLIAPEEALYIRQLNWNIFCHTIVSLFTSSSLCRHDQFAFYIFLVRIALWDWFVGPFLP